MAPRADITEEARRLIAEVDSAVASLQRVRENLSSYMKNLKALDEDLVALDAMKAVFQKAKR